MNAPADSRRFRAAREGEWRRLEEILTRCEKRSVRALDDEELEAFAAADPAGPDDISRAVTAAALLRERRLVITRLRHLGVHVLEAYSAEAGPALVNAYLNFKRRALI